MKVRATPRIAQEAVFFAFFLAYVWAGIDTRLIHHWQSPVFYTNLHFLTDFLKRPGGLVEYLYAYVVQGYASQGWGAILFTLQAIAATRLTAVWLERTAGRPAGLARFAPALILLFAANLYYDGASMALHVVAGAGAAAGCAGLARRLEGSAWALAGVAGVFAVTYYADGVALLFCAPAAALAFASRARRKAIAVAACILAAVAAPLTAAWLRLAPSAVSWFTSGDARLLGARGALFLCFSVPPALLLLGRWRAPGFLSRAAATTAIALLALASVATASYRMNARDRRLAALDYYSLREDWPAVIETGRTLAAADFNSLTRYEINLALHETHRMGDEMFRFPQSGSPLLGLRSNAFLPYAIRLADLCLRLGRVNDAERFGGEAAVLGQGDPRVYRVMAELNLVKGETAVARKFLNVLSEAGGHRGWARERLRELEADPKLAGDSRMQLLRRRMLRSDDVLAVWQRPDLPDGDVERLLSDQLAQDPSNRMAFEFLMAGYLTARDMTAITGLMPRIKDMIGPAYRRPDGVRRTPRHYQEAMAMYADMTGKPVNIEGVEIESETLNRIAVFKRIVAQGPTREAALQAAWPTLRDTYFFYYVFGPGDYR